jgi:hypothetical protein
VHIDQYDVSMKLSKLRQLVKLQRFLLNYCQLPTLYSVYGQWKSSGMILTPKNLKWSQNNLFQWQSVHNTIHMNITGIKPGLLGLRTTTYKDVYKTTPTSTFVCQTLYDCIIRAILQRTPISTPLHALQAFPASDSTLCLVHSSGCIHGSDALIT